VHAQLQDLQLLPLGLVAVVVCVFFGLVADLQHFDQLWKILLEIFLFGEVEVGLEIGEFMLDVVLDPPLEILGLLEGRLVVDLFSEVVFLDRERWNMCLFGGFEVVLQFGHGYFVLSVEVLVQVVGYRLQLILHRAFHAFIRFIK